ncbi:MAG: glycosyltransferase [Thermoleophilaceae bacterium]|nr:glycosyltransferase [Thermoleophilaceae bacterium]
MILLVYRYDSTFIAIDRAILGERGEVEDWSGRKPMKPLATWRAVRRSKLVVGWFAGWHAVLPVLFARLQRKPALMIVGGIDAASLPEIGYGFQRGGPRQWAARFCMKRASALLTNSHYSRTELERNAGVDPARVRVVHHGLPDPFGELPVEPRAVSVLTVGVADERNLERKGLRPFVEAAAELPDVPFVLVGRAEGEAGEKLRAIAPANVEITGFVEPEELDQRYRSATIYVQASLHEGFGMAVVEAMLAGAIPVVSDRGALPEVVGDAGIVVEGVDPEAIASGIRRALNEGADMRMRARERALSQFNLDMRERGLLSAVDELVERPPTPARQP